MDVAKSLWASVQGDPVFMRRINGWLTIFWLVMIPISYGMHWLSSVVYVSALSLWALVTGHWSSWQAARVEVAQAREAEERRREPVEDKVVEKIVEKTDVSPAA
jgi:type VI protein secretion system component VasK